MLQAMNHWLGRHIEAFEPAELMCLFEEIYDFRQKGILKGERLRDLEKEFSDKVSHTPGGDCMRLVEEMVLFEMARRFYNEHE